MTTRTCEASEFREAMEAREATGSGGVPPPFSNDREAHSKTDAPCTRGRRKCAFGEGDKWRSDSATPSRFAAMLIFLFLAPILPAQVVNYEEVITREVSVHVGGVQDPEIKDIVTREVSLYVEPSLGITYPEVITREVSLVADAPGIPPQVTDLRITVSPTGATVALDWSSYNQWAVNDVDYYEVYLQSMAFTDISGLTPARIVPGETMATTFTGLTEWTDHFLAVVAVDAAGNRNPAVTYSAAYVLSPEVITREVSLFTGMEPDPPYREVVTREVSLLADQPGVPAPVQDFAVTVSPTGESVALDWSGYNQWAERDVAFYRVYYADTIISSLTGLPFVTVPGETLRTSIAGLPAWQDHYFAVVPMDGQGGSNATFFYGGAYVLHPEVITREVALFAGAEPDPPYRETVTREMTLVLHDDTTPAAVTGAAGGFAATPSRTVYGAIDLDWRSYNELAQRDVAEYRIYVGNSFFSDISQGTLWATSRDGRQQATISGLAPEQIFFVAVVAVDVDGRLNPTVYSISSKASVGAVGDIANLALSGRTFSSLTWTWDLGGVGTDLDDFVREFRVYFGGSAAPVIVDRTLRTWTATWLFADTNYAIRVTTVDLFGRESAGATLPGTTLAAPPGALEPGFPASITGSFVYALAQQPDGKLIIGGNFTAVNGMARNHCARLNADGTLDTGFAPVFDNSLHCLTVLPDGRILAGGAFTAVNGVTRNRMVRLLPDGTVDAGFSVGFDNSVLTVEVQPDGRLLAGGDFTTVSGAARVRLARLNANGSLDTAFPNLAANALVRNARTLPDGRILLAGNFTSISGTGRNRIARLTATGALDTAFNPNASGAVYFALPLPDGRILTGGSFTSIAGTARNRIARLTDGGGIDATFNPNFNGDIYCAALQADGKIIAGGAFTQTGGVSRNRIARLHPDGTLDTAFNPNSDGAVWGIAQSADGRVTAGGAFSNMGGAVAPRLMRLLNDPAVESFSVPSLNRVEWLRGGAAPEAMGVTFEHTAGGTGAWTALGSGTRIPGGWELSGLTLPSIGAVRARAQLAGGLYAASSGLLETVTAYGAATPLEAWKQLHLGDANAPDLGDPDGDGIATLAEYALNLLPQVREPNPFAPALITFADGTFLTITIPRDPMHNDVTVEVQVTGALEEWSTVATSVRGAPFSGRGYTRGENTQPGMKSVEIRDIVPVSSAVRRFLRVKVTR